MSDDVPNEGVDSFKCPHCLIVSQQNWQSIVYSFAGKSNDMIGSVGRCSNCTNYTVWVDEDMVFPKASSAPHPHEEMPDGVERDYVEARLVLDDSPRAAAALLRLSIQRLMENHL